MLIVEQSDVSDMKRWFFSSYGVASPCVLGRRSASTSQRGRLSDLRHRQRTDPIPVLVEGRRDRRTLASLGIIDRVIVLNRGWPIERVRLDRSGTDAIPRTHTRPSGAPDGLGSDRGDFSNV